MRDTTNPMLVADGECLKLLTPEYATTKIRGQVVGCVERQKE